MALNNMGLGFTFTARDLASGTIGRLQGELRGLGVSGAAATSALSRGMGIAAAGIVPLAAGLGGLAAALGLVETAASSLHEIAAVGSEFENVQIRMAGTLQALHFVDDFEGGMSRSSELIRRIHADAAALPGEAQDYVNVFTQALPQIAGAMDGNLSDMTAWADRFTAIAISLGVDSAQAARDLQLMLATGRGRAGANVLTFQRLLPFIQATGEHAHLTAQEFNAMSETERWEVLEGAMAGLNDQLEASGGTWDSIVGATSTLWDNLVRISTAPLFSSMKTQLDRINGLFVDESGELTRFGQAIADVGIAVSDSVGAALEGVTDFIIGLADGITGILNVLAGVLRVMPNWVIPAAFAIWVLVSAFLALGGALVVLVGVGVMIAPFFVAIVKVLAGMLIVLAPLTLAALAFGAAIAAVVVAVRNNWGGLGDFWNQTLARMRLAWTALEEAITRGGFTEATSDALQAEPGIRRFVVGVAMLVFRLRQMWEGFSTGMAEGWARIQPAVTRLGAAVRRLGAAFGFLGGETEEAGGALPSRDFAEFGAEIADMVISGIERIVNALTFLADTGTAVFNNLRSAFEFFAPIFRALGRHVSALWEEFSELLTVLGVISDSGEGDAASFGEVIAYVFAGIVSYIASTIDMFVMLARAAVWVATQIVRVFNDVQDFFFGLGVNIGLVFMRIVDAVMNAIDNTIATLAGLVARIPAPLRPDGAEELIAEGPVALRRVRERTAEAGAREARGRELLARDTNATIDAEAAARRSETEDRTAEIVAAVEAARIADRDRRAGGGREVIELRVDGEVLARTTADAARREGARGFVPVPAGSE